jgi:stage II sporulation protein GA (sporulation sigma-E factor processing peptidase)
MNYIVLFATTIIVKSKVRIIGTLVSAILGSIYAVTVYVTKSEIYSNTVLKVGLSVIMCYIAFVPKNLKMFFKYLLIFYLTSFTFGGVAFGLIYFIKPQNIFSNNGILIGQYPIKIILAGGFIGFIIIILGFKIIKGKLSKKDIMCNLKITIEDKNTFVKAIIDTGNFLKEPITGLPVVVVEKEKLYEIVPENILDNLKKIILGEDANVGEYISKIRLIPFNSLGKENGLLIGIKADNICIDYDEKDIHIKNVIIGIYDGTLSKTKKYQALIGLEFLEMGGIENEYSEVVKI